MGIPFSLTLVFLLLFMAVLSRYSQLFSNTAFSEKPPVTPFYKKKPLTPQSLCVLLLSAVFFLNMLL